MRWSQTTTPNTSRCASRSRSASPKRRLQTVSAPERLETRKKRGEKTKTTHPSEAMIAQRKKQITWGKNTQGYRNMVNLHKQTTNHHGIRLATPDPDSPISKRRFDGVVKKWRRKLHEYDTIRLRKTM